MHHALLCYDHSVLQPVVQQLVFSLDNEEVKWSELQRTGSQFAMQFSRGSIVQRVLQRKESVVYGTRRNLRWCKPRPTQSNGHFSGKI
eukprot:scaffold6095_cov84-Skeletonema_dohrnii-CCMP3373.AAC.2